ncbi:hypothetical protein RFI_29230 [Reticulomyxa filosa]|uniref:Uncharacterized protein n=1 Tax=Reticulomyxa filosa TaxID=46433 RepID=X6M2M8_RETFI|nr:hypothetical protein RFI_29230 [Reticulomyxa filosa]|eukprot:ETO08164.1 hypothetical protein RFI_29230 [Reticulomyxa filosa]
MLVYNEANVMSVVSLFVSIVSISTKLLLVIDFDFDNETYTRIWLYVCLHYLDAQDFFGAFFVAALVLDAPTADGHTYNLMSTLFYYKLFIVSIPLILWPHINYLLGVVIALTSGLVQEIPIGCYFCILCWCGYCHVIIRFVGMVAASTLVELAHFTILAMLVQFVLTKRIAHCYTFTHIYVYVFECNVNKFFFYWDQVLQVLSFLQEGPDIGLRMACANHEFGYLKSYLNKEVETLYAHVTLKTLRQAGQSSFARGNFFFLLLLEYMEPWNHVKQNMLPHLAQGRNIWTWNDLFVTFSTFGLTFILLPLYSLSRFLTVLFPVIFALYVYHFDLWAHVGTLQIVLTCVYFALQLICCVLFIPVFRIHYLLWLNFFFSNTKKKQFMHISPGVKLITPDWSRLPRIKKRYDLVKAWPVREQLLNDIFGSDVTHVINSYLPKIDFGDDNSQKKI